MTKTLILAAIAMAAIALSTPANALCLQTDFQAALACEEAGRQADDMKRRMDMLEWQQQQFELQQKLDAIRRQSDEHRARLQKSLWE